MLDGIRHALNERLARHKYWPFLDACMSACALVAIADGEVSLSEQSRVDQILEQIDRLKLYDVHQAVDLFNERVDAIVNNRSKGRKVALDAIARVADDREAAELIVKVSLAVSWADGTFLESERAQLDAICSVLGLDLVDFEKT